MAELTQLRAELPWLADVPRDVGDQLLDRLDIAWRRCFTKLARQPRWKGKSDRPLSLTVPSSHSWRIENSMLRFAKLGDMRAIIHRPLIGAMKSCTLRDDAGQWFAMIVCEVEVPDPAPRHAPAIALDRGVTNLVADSDGAIVKNPKYMDAAAKRLARAQRSVSRKKKGSKNREKAKRRVAVMHRKVRRQREHFIHNLTSRYAKSHGVVVVEKLQIEKMTKSASGTRESPGRGVRQKTGLNRSISSTGWGELVRQLRYKLAWSGGTLVEVPAQYSSQTCHGCGHIDPKNRNGESFECVGCGLVEHADVNAAKVLLQRFQTPGNPWCLPVDGSACKGPGRSRKRLRTSRRSTEARPFGGE